LWEERFIARLAVGNRHGGSIVRRYKIRGSDMQTDEDG